ncbi:DeoR/GlpR transcriptional regulator [Methylorubrum populi]|uniref:DeoR/GlpR family DNA-binding transcription regulator n=1 Tax=Methylorubrum TaxID=2282523 RepID=UPI0011541778|nr:DeoR/GlpR family DNA-binding transcription regulator [Methylorubrum populi]QDI79911.1 DeoR/GlpR transcriptional regulator [Methylorubrum populi]
MKTGKSRKELRHQRIMAVLESNPSARVNQLAEELEVSTETVRRDLAELDQVGRLNRTYGGAVSATNRFEPALNERLSLFVPERRAMARLAVELYAKNDALLLGGGATLLHLARALRDITHRLTVVTPAYPVAIELAANPLIEVMVLPGMFEPQEGIVCGPETVRALERFRAPVAIIGASGLNHDGVSEALISSAEVYSSIIRNADHCVVLADHSKFGKRALTLISDWSPRLSLITDIAPQPEIAAAMDKRGSKFAVAPTDVT